MLGTKLHPLIPQTRTPDFDTTATQSDVSTVSLTSSARNLRHKVWYTGSGEGEGIVRVSAQDLKGVENGQPFLEQVFSESDTDSADLLQRRAAGALGVSSQMVDQLTMGSAPPQRRTHWAPSLWATPPPSPSKIGLTFRMGRGR